MEDWKDLKEGEGRRAWSRALRWQGCRWRGERRPKGLVARVVLRRGVSGEGGGPKSLIARVGKGCRRRGRTWTGVS